MYVLGEKALKILILNSIITIFFFTNHQTKFKVKKAYNNSEEKIFNQH